MKMQKRYNITPVAKPRMTQGDKWKKRPKVTRYRAFKDQVALNKIELSECGARVLFLIPMPKSWSKKKKGEMIGKPHKQKPDLDNLIKALGDAVYKDDSVIWNITATKRWWDTGMISIEKAP
jgi:Holliday junction resolvase RusA-like endonuclease